MNCSFPVYQSIKLSEVVNDLQPLFKVVSDVFGPQLAKVILAKSIGNVSITNDGVSILNAVSTPNPIVKLVIKSCCRQIKQCGNNGKTFFMMVYISLLSLASKFRKKSTSFGEIQQQKAAKCLTWFRNVILLDENFYSFVLKSLSTKKIHLLNMDFKKEAEKVVQSSLSGKYSSQACNVLTTNILDLFADCHSVTIFVSTAIYIKKYFDVIVFEISGVPMHESIVLKGVLIKKQLPFNLSKEKLSTHNCILATFDDALSPSSNVKLKLCNTFNLSCTLYTKYLLNWIKECIKLNVSVILFQGEALATFRSLCEENDIALIDCLLEENVNFVSSALEILPVYDISEKIDFSNIIKVKLKEIRLGNETFTNLINVNSEKVINTALICSPSAGLCSQYKASVYNSILTLQHWIMGCNNTAQLINGDTEIETFSVQGNGLFFISLYKVLTNKDLTMSVIKKINLTDFELEMFNCARDLVSDMLLIVPQVLHQNLLGPKDKTTRFVQYLHNLDIDCAKLKYVKCEVTNSLVEIIEPACCLYTVLCNAISCLEKVLRIDGVISLNKTFHNRQ